MRPWPYVQMPRLGRETPIYKGRFTEKNIFRGTGQKKPKKLSSSAVLFRPNLVRPGHLVYPPGPGGYTVTVLWYAF